jgi:molecular chaperone DnaJ
MQVRAVCDNCGGEGKTYAQKCRQCGGSGVESKSVDLKIKIPAGIDDGESIRLSGQGEAGQKGAPSGDLYVTIKVSRHPNFFRDGYDIRSKTKIKIYQAASGDKIEVDTVHGPVKLKIPAGTQSGAIFKLRAKGAPRLRSGGYGDHFVEVIVDIPSNLNRKQKEALKDLDI